MGTRDGDLRVRADLTIPAAELELDAVRAGGPGGQNVNKVATKVQLRWNVRESRALDEGQRRRLLERLAHRINARGELVLGAARHREQRRNREDARERLARLVEGALRAPRPRRPTRPTRASRERRLADKRQRAETKKGRRPPPDGS